MSTITPNGYQLEQYLIGHHKVARRIDKLLENIEKARAELADIAATIRITPDYAREAHGNTVSDPVATAYTHALTRKDKLNGNIALYAEQVAQLEEGISDMSDCLSSLGRTDQYIVRIRYTTDEYTNKPTPCWKIGDMLGKEFGTDATRDERTIRRHLTEEILPAIVDYLSMFCPEILRRICAVRPPAKRVINTRYKSAFFEEIAV